MQQIEQQPNGKSIAKTMFYCIWLGLVCFHFGAARGLELNNFTRKPIISPITLYVSLGMPDNVLKSYLVQAHQLHIPVILRGLYTENSQVKTREDMKDMKNMKKIPIIGSFKDTASRIFALLKDQSKHASAIKGGVLIDPMRYRRYHIKAVPALVIANKDNNKSDNGTDFDVLYGNIPIKRALVLMTQKSENRDLSQIAQKRLDQYAATLVNNVKVN